MIPGKRITEEVERSRWGEGERWGRVRREEPEAHEPLVLMFSTKGSLTV